MLVYFKLDATQMFVNVSDMLVNDGEMLVNDGETSIWSYTHFTIINEHFSSTSLKYTIILSSEHHWEAALTVYSILLSMYILVPIAHNDLESHLKLIPRFF